MAGFACSTCGQYHNELPLCFGAEKPDFYYSVPPEERAARVELSRDWCVVDETHFFIRGRIEIPIIDYHESLVWNVWTSLSEESFRGTMDAWNDPKRVLKGPYFGWLQTIVPSYENTLNIKTWVHAQPVGHIPQVEVFEEGHALTLDQQVGITLAQAKQIVEALLHDD
jgi:hypothetical protein